MPKAERLVPYTSVVRLIQWRKMRDVCFVIGEVIVVRDRKVNRIDSIDREVMQNNWHIQQRYANFPTQIEMRSYTEAYESEN